MGVTDKKLHLGLGEYHGGPSACLFGGLGRHWSPSCKGSANARFPSRHLGTSADAFVPPKPTESVGEVPLWWVLGAGCWNSDLCGVGGGREAFKGNFAAKHAVRTCWIGPSRELIIQTYTHCSLIEGKGLQGAGWGGEGGLLASKINLHLK